MKLVITMSRRFGTGASIIAGELSERLGIPVYDKAYIEEKLNDHMYESEAEAIRKLAEKPCIILGRCASDILKDRMNVLNIFVCADKEDRIRRIMGKENLSYEDAREKVERTDEERASYYYEHTGNAPNEDKINYIIWGLILLLLLCAYGLPLLGVILPIELSTVLMAFAIAGSFLSVYKVCSFRPLVPCALLSRFRM